MWDGYWMKVVVCDCIGAAAEWPPGCSSGASDEWQPWGASRPWHCRHHLYEWPRQQGLYQPSVFTQPTGLSGWRGLPLPVQLGIYVPEFMHISVTNSIMTTREFKWQPWSVCPWVCPGLWNKLDGDTARQEATITMYKIVWQQMKGLAVDNRCIALINSPK